MSESHTSIIASLREELAGAQKENEELRRENGKQRETINRANAQMAALTEENEELRKERDSLQQQLEEANEQHATELREVTEEMAAAARFSDSEWREHCDRVEAEGQRLRSVIVAVSSTALELLVGAEEAARRRLQDEEEAQRCDLQGPRWKASLEGVPAREAARIEAVFAARGLSMSELRRTHLGKAPATKSGTYAAGEGLYNLFLALRPGGPVDRFAMRELLKGETNVKHVYYNTQGQEVTWGDTDFTIPAGDAYELAACVLCHLPALEVLGFSYLPPLSTRSLVWVSHLPQCMLGLSFWYTDYTVADLREMHRRRGGRTLYVVVHRYNCTDWGKLAAYSDATVREGWLNVEFDTMVWWK